MPFTRMNRSPDSSTLLKPDGLVFMSLAQLEEHTAYWRNVEALGGFLQMQLGQTFLAALQHAAAYRRVASLPREKRPQPQSDIVGITALAGLAMSQLMRSAYTADVEHGRFEPNAETPALDIDMREEREEHQVANVHHPSRRIGEVLPGYDPDASFQYHEDSSLVVRASAPAAPTENFRQQYAAVGDGRKFDTSEYVTLMPLLKVDFIRPAE